MKTIRHPMILTLHALLYTMWPSRLLAAEEINTITVPEVFLTRQTMTSVPSQEPLDFKSNIVASFQLLTDNMTMVFKHFAIVLGVMVLLASLFQYFRYRENPMATRLSYVSTTFFCGMILIGISLITPNSI